jgi:hypothetical protein
MGETGHKHGSSRNTRCSCALGVIGPAVSKVMVLCQFSGSNDGTVFRENEDVDAMRGEVVSNSGAARSTRGFPFSPGYNSARYPCVRAPRVNIQSINSQFMSGCAYLDWHPSLRGDPSNRLQFITPAQTASSSCILGCFKYSTVITLISSTRSVTS